MTSIFTRDIFAGCRTGEVIEPTPRSPGARLRTVGIGIAAVALLAAFKTSLWEPWLAERSAALHRLMATDPVLGSARWADHASVALLVPVLFGLGAAAWITLVSWRVLRAGRWPLPGARARVRTHVIGGWCVYLRFGGVAVLGPVLACVIWYQYVQLVSFFWNRHFDTVAAAAVAAHSHTNVPSKFSKESR
ncbi:MAG TPA: hypothetical protein VFB32_16620 [Rudaea sp.]|nr:hypothetical protein [Rudaea sp.]